MIKFVECTVIDDGPGPAVQSANPWDTIPRRRPPQKQHQLRKYAEQIFAARIPDGKPFIPGLNSLA